MHSSKLMWLHIPEQSQGIKSKQNPQSAWFCLIATLPGRIRDIKNRNDIAPDVKTCGQYDGEIRFEKFLRAFELQASMLSVKFAALARWAAGGRGM